MPKHIKLDPRLLAIAHMLGADCGIVADIGTDHGLLGGYLLQSGQCNHVQFLDISDGSLAKARSLIDELGLPADCASFGVGDGAKAMTRQADSVVIAGMGGQLIADIIESGIDVLRGCKLVLQPNVAQWELRCRLSDMGFIITAERIVRAAGRYYVVMAAQWRDAKADYSDRELLIGPGLIHSRAPEFLEYARRNRRIAKKALEGARLSDAPWRERLEFEVQCWEGIIHEAGEGL